MNLDETQRQKVAGWINEGLKVAEIQTRLEKELGLRMTYLEVRFLIDELKLTPKDPTPPPPAKKPEEALQPEEKLEPQAEPEPEPMPQGGVSVSVDQIARPGAVVSGKVTFSDGKTATWLLDDAGRLGIGATEKGYKPPPGDVQEFQMQLQRELQKIGF